MQNDTSSLKVFKCPSCGAPLEPQVEAPTMRCPYCGASVYIPEPLRASAKASTPGTLSNVTELARQGKLDEAAKIYSKITGLNYDYAMISVKSMAGIRDDEPASARPGTVNQSQASPVYQTPPSPQPTYYPPKTNVRSPSCLSAVIRLVILIVIVSSALPALLRALQINLPSLPFFSGENPIIPEPFAKEVMSFSPSSLKDPRAIGLDGNGNILLFNYNSSDVQIFDPAGSELLVMKITESDGDELNNTSMGVSQNGTIYVPGFQGILVFNQQGERLREISDDENLFIIYSVMIGADNKLYARSNSGIIRFNENGEMDLKITDETLEEVSGEYPGTGAMGVDAQGNIYFSGTFNKDVLKFSPTGEFISSFGGDFTSVRHITFDSHGRIYVVDFSDVKVYDANYNYIDQIDGAFWGVDFDSQNYMYAVTTQGDDVLKYEIRSPAP